MTAQDLGIEGIARLVAVTAGGTSIIYRGYQSAMDRVVAVKVLSQSDVAVRRRFDRERKAMGRLSRHRGVVTVYETGYTSDGRPFLVMPWIEGGSLQDRLDASGPVEWQEAVDIVAEVADTLQSAHESGVVHADVKPANLLVAADGSVLVADFGIARLLDFAQTQTRSVALSPLYAAPEVVAGERPTAATDIYGLGATLFALIEGHPPFETDGDLVALADAVASTDAPSLSNDVPAPVLASYVRSMAKSPGDRFSSAADFAAALRGSSTGSSPHPESGNRRHTRGWVLAAAFAVVLVALGSGFVVNRFGVSEGSDIAPPATSTVATTRTIADTTDASSVVPPPPAAPTTVAPTTIATTTVPPPLSVADVFGKAAVQEIPLQGALRSAQYDGGVVWVTRDDDDGRGTVVRIDATSGAVIETIPVGTAPRGPVFVDGSAWIFNAGDGTLVRIESNGGSVVETIKVVDARDPSSPTVAQDLGRPVAAADGRIWIAANTDDDTLVSVTATAPDTGNVEAIDVKLLSARPLIAADDSVWILGEAVCYDANQSWTNAATPTPEARKLEEFGIPVDTMCRAVVRVDLSADAVSTPVLVEADSDVEWIDPDSRVPTVLCTVGLSNCVAGTRPASELYTGVSAWWKPVQSEAAPGFYGGGFMWASAYGGVYSINDSGEQVGLYSCVDAASVQATASLFGDVLWIWGESDGLCALDVTRSIDVSDACGSDVPCSTTFMESGLPLFMAESPPLDLEMLPTVVATGYGNAVWVVGLDGRLVLVDFVQGKFDASVEILLEYDIGPGLVAPLVTPDGSVWLASQGRITRIRPDITPAQYALPADGD